MPSINEIQDQSALLAVVLAIGFAAGWFARTALLRIKQAPIVDMLTTTQKVFLIDEHSVAKQIQFAVDMMEMLRTFSEASQRASKLAEDRMKEYREDFVELYQDNLVPNILEDVKNLVRKLLDEADVAKGHR